MRFIVFSLILLANFLLLIKINQNKDIFFKMSLIMICPLIFFPHSNYDYILLFPLLCFSLRNIEYFISRINIYFVIYFFYFNRIVKHLLDIDFIYQPISLIFLILLLFTNIYSYKMKDNLYIFNFKII